MYVETRISNEPGLRKNTLFTVLFHYLDDCDLYMPPRGVKGWQNQVENDQN